MIVFYHVIANSTRSNLQNTPIIGKLFTNKSKDYGNLFLSFLEGVLSRPGRKRIDNANQLGKLDPPEVQSEGGASE